MGVLGVVGVGYKERKDMCPCIRINNNGTGRARAGQDGAAGRGGLTRGIYWYMCGCVPVCVCVCIVQSRTRSVALCLAEGIK